MIVLKDTATHILIDSGVLGKLCNPNSSPEVESAREQLYALLAKEVYIVSSQICDYEVRRSLILNSLRGFSSEGIENLNKLSEFVVIATTNVKHLSRFTEAKKWQEISF